VGYYNSHKTLLDAFQLQLISLGNGDFDIVFRYENINWTTGDSSGGSNGLGGTPARAGYSAGDGNATHYFEVQGSGSQTAMLALPNTVGNTGIAGVDVFQVQNGNVSTAPVANGTIVFSDPDDNAGHTASFAPASGGSGYIGMFSLDASVNEATQSVGWHFTLSNSEVSSFFNPTAGHIRTQAYTVTVGDGHPSGTASERVAIEVGTASNDTFVFAPGTGENVVYNYANQSGASDKVEIDGFGIARFNDLALQAVNNNHDTLIDLGHGDSITLIGVTASTLHNNDFILNA
jgi:VCBS repeat-containing protein